MAQKPGREVAVIDAHGKHAQAVQFTNDGRLLVSCGQDARVRLWSVPGFAPVGVMEGHTNSVNTLSLDPDQKLLATGSTDCTVRLWSFPDGRCLHTFESQVAGVFSSHGSHLATLSRKGNVTIWDAGSGERIVSTPVIDKRTTTIALTPGGESLLVGGTGAIHRLRVTDGSKEGELKGHKVVVACLCVSADGGWLASTGGDGFLRFWDTRNWKELRSVRLPRSGVFQIAVSPRSDGVAVSMDSLIHTYSAKSGELADEVDLPVKGVYGVAISPDGQYLANAASDGKVRVWKR